MTLGEKQHLSSLHLLLYSRSLHPELFCYYDQRNFVMKRYECHVAITGVSHLISFHRDEKTLVEVLAESDSVLPERGKLLDLSVRGSKSHCREMADGISYIMNLDTETMSEDVYLTTHLELQKISKRRGMFFDFPGWANGQMPAFSFLDCEAKSDQFHVFSFHAFPDKLTLVKTQSIFELG